MEWYYVCWPWLTAKRVQHQLSFLLAITVKVANEVPSNLSHCISDKRWTMLHRSIYFACREHQTAAVKRQDHHLTLRDSGTLNPLEVVRDLGVLLDCELSMKQHIARIASNCFYHLRRLQQIRRVVGKEVTSQLVSAFVLSRLDHCNSLLAGLPSILLSNLYKEFRTQLFVWYLTLVFVIIVTPG